MRTAGIIILLTVFAFTLGCDGLTSTFRFVNNSSYTVGIAPNGQDWSPAMISPGSSVEVKWSGTIQYVYVPSDKVRVADSEPGRIVFVNR